MDRRSLIRAGVAVGGLWGGGFWPMGAAAQSLTQDPAPVASGRFAAATRYSLERGGTGVLVMRHGVILAEDYPNGGNYRGTIALGPLTSTYAVLLAAALVRERLLSLDEPVFVSFAEWVGDAVKQRITVRQLLQQTSGLQPGPAGAPSPTIGEALALPSVAEPGNIFVDDPASLQIFADLARRKLADANAPTDLALYMQLRALDAVGATPMGWQRQADGLIDLAQGGACSLRALARMGEFVRRRGHWRAEFRVSPQTLDAASVGTLASKGRVGMGWRRANGPPLQTGETMTSVSDLWGQTDLPEDALFAHGPEGLRCFIVPSRAVVVARAGLGRPQWSDAAFLRAVLNEA